MAQPARPGQRHHPDARQRSRAELAPSAHAREKGRTPLKGRKLPTLAEIASSAVFEPVTVTGPDGRSRAIQVHEFTCLWYKPFYTRPVKVVLIRNPGTEAGFDVALASTDADIPAAELIARYDSRWTIETANQEAKAHGVGEARNRVQKAVERTVPFGFLPRQSRSRGTPFTATPKPTSTSDSASHPGTARRRPSATPTCSPRYAASSSATSFGHKHPP